jgi:hypothetical protein
MVFVISPRDDVTSTGDKGIDYNKGLYAHLARNLSTTSNHNCLPPTATQAT